MTLIKFVSACCAVILLASPVAAETLVLNDAMTVFDGEMYGATGCDSEFPLRNCQFLNRGGADIFSVGKAAAHISTVWRSLMGFDFSGLPDHDLVELDSAILTLTCGLVSQSNTVLHLGFQSLKYNVIEGIVAESRTEVEESDDPVAAVGIEYVDQLAILRRLIVVAPS